MSCQFSTLPNVVMCQKYPFFPGVDVKVGSAVKGLCRRSLVLTYWVSGLAGWASVLAAGPQAWLQGLKPVAGPQASGQLNI